MITQIFKCGKSEIKIEQPESLEDAKKHKFADGQPNRIFIDGKPTDNYLAMIQFMVAESKKNNKNFVPDEKNLISERKKLFTNQQKAMKEQFDKIKAEYKLRDTPQSVLDFMDDFEKKISVEGIRNVE